MMINNKRGLKDQSVQVVGGDGSWKCWQLPLSRICNRQLENLCDHLRNNTWKVLKFVQELGLVAKSSTQIACACLKRGLQQKLNFVSRTTTNSRNIFKEAEASMQTHVLLPFFASPVSHSANDRANAHLTLERLAHDERTAHLNKIWPRKKDLMEIL